MSYQSWWFKFLMRQRMQARHAERERIARDLHDTLLQGIQALLFRLQIWASDPTIPAERRDEIAAVVVQARAIVVEVRDRLVGLRSTAPESQDLLASLTAVARAESNGKTARFEISSTGKHRLLLAEACEQLVDIAREAIRNAHQHACASLVALSVDYRNSSLRLRIADDGRGIDPAVPRAGHFGLVGMRERAAQLGARFAVERNGANGTRVTVVAPAGVVFEERARWTWRPVIRR
jgi:signal transduction histidine kinase